MNPMNLRCSMLLCTSSLFAAMLFAQTPQPASQPPRAIPEPYKATIPPSPGDLTVWPRGVSPQEVGKALAEHFVKTPVGQTVAYPGRTSQSQTIGYPEVCS